MKQKCIVVKREKEEQKTFYSEKEYKFSLTVKKIYMWDVMDCL